MAQKLDPKMKEMYERVMKTPTKKPVTASQPSPQTPSPEPKPTPPPSEKSPFLSSMPIQPAKNLGVKTFTFTGGKKKAAKEEAHESSTAQTSKPEKKKASSFLIALVVLGFIALWGLLWAFIFKFI
jgi:hypothetical protein